MTRNEHNASTGSAASGPTVLIGAYACEPNRGSEPGAGLAWALGAAEAARRVVVLTRTNNRASLETIQQLPENLTFEYFDLPRPIRTLKKRVPYGTQIYYALWHFMARRKVHELSTQYRFDVTHHLTFAVDWLPSAVHVKGVPFVWGPVGGAVGLPWRLWRHQGVPGILRESAREVFARVGRRVFGRAYARSAAIIMVQNHEEAGLWRDSNARIQLEPNVTVDSGLLGVGTGSSAPPSFRRGSARRAVFAGRLIPHKGLSFAIRALAEPTASDWSLHVLGDGPERVKCEKLAAQLGIADRVHFEGLVPREQVLASLHVADALVAPSMYEGSGFSVAEALTVGCPVVATDRGGPAAMVGRDKEGALVPADANLHRHVANALGRLGPRHAGTDRWSADRLPGLLQDVYSRACL